MRRRNDSIADVINSGIRLGQWPDIYKMETITPAPKCYPPKELDNLRPISNFFNYRKIGEKIIGHIIVEDMVEKTEPLPVWQPQKHINTTSNFSHS